ncbi:hypothetical protein EJA10_22345 [Mesobacillus subterraneus]|uniref:Peptidase C39-like domain-containing protein n=2 Tax=Mesobacillus subterraneus TaxID=285983 RepID=A0A427TDX0_9BACI|nr:hypothetical protein EJA10_22345 [Mesobacillus subterraneus]
MYGKHATGIRYKLYLNSSGYVSSGTQREKGTQKVLVSYKFKAKTTYGNQWKQVGERKINVPVVKQLPELPTGCEITAVTMMLQYQGAKVGKLQLANEMPRHPWDPSYGYVGNPYTTKGWTVYPSALMGLVKKHAGKSENLSGYSLMRLEYYLSKNKPVVVWVSPMHGFTVHAITLTGYDKDNFYFNDPWTGAKNVKMSKSKFIKIWTNQNKRAISY